MVLHRMMAMRKTTLKTFSNQNLQSHTKVTSEYRGCIISNYTQNTSSLKQLHLSLQYYLKLFKILYKYCICFCQTTSYTVCICHMTIHISSEKYNSSNSHGSQ